MKLKTTIVFLFSVLLCSQYATAQFDRYLKFRNDSQEALAREDFSEAINSLFFARYYASDTTDIYLQIRRIQDLWVGKLRAERENAITLGNIAKKARDRARVAQRLAELKQKETDSLRIIERSQRIEIEEKGISAEANRLALQSENTLEDDPASALLLAYMSRYLTEPDPSKHILRSFGNAVYAAKSKIRNFDKKILFAQLIPGTHAVVSILADSSIYKWDYLTDTLSLINTSTDRITTIAISPSGSAILTALSDSTLWFWNLKTNEKVKIHGHKEEITDMVFSPNNDYFLTCSRDDTLRVYRADSTYIIRVGAIGHKDNVFSGMFSPIDAAQYISRSSDGTVKLIDTRADTSLTIDHQPYIYSAKFSPAGDHIATASVDGNARLRRLDGNLTAILDHGSPVKSTFFGPGQGQVITQSWDSTLIVWDYAGDTLYSFDHSHDISAIRFNWNSDSILTCSLDGSVRWHDLTSERSEVLAQGEHAVIDCQLSQDNLILATTSDGHSRLYNRLGTELMDLHLGNEIAFHSVFSFDGTHILTAADKSQIRITPIPDVVYQEMVSSWSMSPTDTNLFFAKYDIEFFKDSFLKIQNESHKYKNN